MPRGPHRGRRARYSLGKDPRARRLHSSWYRGSTLNFTPSKLNLTEADALERYIAHGWAPEKPILEPDAGILAVGSCFAQYIAQHLRRRRRRMRINDGMNCNVLAYGAGFVNTFTLRQQFEWAFGLREIEGSTLFVEHGENQHELPGIKLMETTPTVRQVTRQLIESTDAFILTLGLSEVWYERESGDVFFGAVPSDVYDEERHAFRVTTVEENRANLFALYRLLRARKPDSPIIFTLSPVPLTATFRPVSCLTANCVSKAVLRVAVDELLREVDDDPLLYYWPSYEIVTDFFGPDRGYNEDRRHVSPEVVGAIMALFEKRFVKEE